ncbi:MAG TPA: hypothetical protein VHI13_11685 [Candidatus Kapabacteria bacterium]|nr:hypothetical protein [Candidatus Kapabacteria bacterium]
MPEAFENATRFARWAVVSAKTQDELRDLLERQYERDGDGALPPVIIHGRLVYLRRRRSKQ